MKTIFKYISVLLALFSSKCVWAQTEEPKTFEGWQTLDYVMVGVAILLAIVIFSMSKVVITIYQDKINKYIDDTNESSGLLKSILLIGMMTFPFWAQAQDAVAVVEPAWYTKISPKLLIFSIVLITELTIILILLRVIYMAYGIVKEPKVAKVESQKESIWSKLFPKQSEKEVAEVDLNHDYDGISELDNRIPSWWMYAFYGSILFGIVYMYRMYGNHSMPTQQEELDQSMAQAEIEKYDRMKNSPDKVDENTVIHVTDASDIAEGKKWYDTRCVACHGDKGQGGVGPNLTDDYWIHGGSIADIFKSIKYGWKEKGMQAWSNELSGTKIQQVVGYIQSLNGTNPPGAKAAQGELFKDTPEAEILETAAKDPNAQGLDSATTAISTKSAQ